MLKCINSKNSEIFACTIRSVELLEKQTVESIRNIEPYNIINIDQTCCQIPNNKVL